MTKPNCTSKSQSCGNACIERKDICRSKLSDEASELAKSLAEELTLDDVFQIQSAGHSVDREKVKRLQEAGLTKTEAQAFGQYIGTKYADMNRAMYAPQTMASADLEYYNSLNRAAAKGLAKLPSYTNEELDSYISANTSKYASERSPDGLLTHCMKLDGDVYDSFLAKHKVGDTVEAGKFLSTSWAEDGGSSMFAQGANVRLRVLPIDDGTGSGKAVDQYKNALIEDEILFHPATRFRVTAINKQLDYEETVVNKVHINQLQNAIRSADAGMAPSYIESQLVQYYTPGQTDIEAAWNVAKKGKLVRTKGELDIFYKELPAKQRI